MSMKSWRTLGLKASKSLKIITTGGCCGSSLTGELRLFPGAPVLDFWNTGGKIDQTRFYAPNCKCKIVYISYVLWSHLCFCVVPITKCTEGAVHALVELSTGLLSLHLLLIIHSHNSTHQPLQDPLHQMLQCWNDKADDRKTWKDKL